MNGKIAIVTGAASGIGLSLTRRLLGEGAIVCAWDLNEAALADLAKYAAQNGGEVRTRVVDVTNAKAMAEGARAVREEMGRIDFWFNNAGIAHTGPFSQLADTQFDKILQVDLHAVVNGTRIALEHMEETGSGVIVNTASVAGHVPAPFLVAYSTAKHAVVGFTRALREELRLRDSSVRLALVSPGFVDTAILQKGQAFGFPEWLSWALSSADHVSKEIIAGLKKGNDEIFPALNGRLILRMHRHFPSVARKGTRLLLAESFKDFLLNRYRAE